jgi:hypothetical protein
MLISLISVYDDDDASYHSVHNLLPPRSIYKKFVNIKI